MGCPVPWPCSVSSYSTLKPETVSEAETQEMTKLLEVISVTDSEMSTTGGGCVVSPCDVATTGEIEMENERVGFLLPLRSELAAAEQDNLKKGFYVSVRNSWFKINNKKKRAQNMYNVMRHQALFGPLSSISFIFCILQTRTSWIGLN